MMDNTRFILILSLSTLTGSDAFAQEEPNPKTHKPSASMAKPGTQESKVIRLASGDWFPYTSSKEEGGILEDVIDHAFETQGYSIQIDYFPWIRSAKLVEHSKYDATFPWYPNAEREELFTISSTPLIHVETVMFYHEKVEFEWDEIADLSQYEVGGVLGYASTELLIKHGIDIISATSMEENVYKLYRHRIDALPMERQVGLSMIKEITQDDSGRIQVSDKPLISKPMYMFFPKTDKGEELCEIFDKGLNTIIQNGCYDLLLSNKPCH
ncbi:MAG: transporter substrate-binding domain-containing protein [Vibrio gallaecicus]